MLLPAADLDRALANVAAFKKRLRRPDPFSEEDFRKRDAEVYHCALEVLGPELAAQRSPEDGKALSG